jgi:hypothetical protein
MSADPGDSDLLITQAEIKTLPVQVAKPKYIQSIIQIDEYAWFRRLCGIGNE